MLRHLMPLRLARNVAFVAGCAISAVAAAAAAANETIELNPHTKTYDDHPSASVAPDGTTWLAWHTYLESVDGVVARRIDPDGRLSPLQRLSESGRTHGPPTIVADSMHRAAVVWPSPQAGRWQIMLRQWRNGRWITARRLSNPQQDAIYPTAVLDGKGGLLVAWSAGVGDAFQIRGCRIGAEDPLPQSDDLPPSFEITGDRSPDEVRRAYRPILVRHGDEVWAFWDQYRRPNYAVHGRRVLPALGADRTTF